MQSSPYRFGFPMILEERCQGNLVSLPSCTLNYASVNPDALSLCSNAGRLHLQRGGDHV
jgi:hypothetical protein